MFDANLRYISAGRRVFAECNYIDNEDDPEGFGEPYKEVEGVKAGDVILCYMVTQGHENPVVIMYLNGKHTEVSSNSTGYSWFVYAGRPDGGGFIDDEVKAKALKVLGGEWE